jgi:hypothetical protein
MSTYSEELKRRLLLRIDIADNGCWNWLGSKGTNGYGTITYLYRTLSCHRASWIVHFETLPDDACVLHKCDNRACINPDHLFLGTYQDNHDDMHRKGRSNHRHGAKLTYEQVDEIKYLLGEGSLSQYKIGQIYGVSRSAVLQIHLGLSYNRP